MANSFSNGNGDHRWPAAMRRKTAARYLDLSEAEFSREVTEGRIPSPFRLGRSDHWRKGSIDRALGLDQLEPAEDDWRSRVKAYQAPPADQPVPAEPAELPPIFTPAALARHWGMSVERIYSLFQSGQLQGFRLGAKLIRFRAADVVETEARLLAQKNDGKVAE